MASLPKRSDGCFIVYPEKCFVPAARIAVWYADAVANGEVVALEASLSDSMAEQARALADAGIITLRGTSK